MELGATVCRPRTPGLRGVPGRSAAAAGLVAGRAAARKPAQRFEDTDRWARGRVVAALLAGEASRCRASGSNAPSPASSATA